jgi:hypothetical protein
MLHRFVERLRARWVNEINSVDPSKKEELRKKLLLQDIGTINI